MCKQCHDDIHKGLWEIKKKPKMFKYPAHLQQGNNYLLGMLNKIINNVEIVYGWQTSRWRKELGLSKEHHNDAISMICKERKPLLNFKDNIIIPKRKKVWEDNPSKTCVEKNGFRHGDLIKARRKGVIYNGIIRSLKKNSICIKIKGDDNSQVSYNKTKLLYRFNNLQFY